MKSLVCLLFVVLTFGNAYGQQKKSNKKKPIAPWDRPIDKTTAHLNELTPSDKIKYPLTISRGSSVKSSCAKNGLLYKVNIVLKNTTNDTLRYIDYTCSHEIWITSNNSLRIIFNTNNCYILCESNFITTFDVPPHRNLQFFFYILYKDKVSPLPPRFKIGMILQRAFNENDVFRYLQYFEVHNMPLYAQTQNTVWSNEIALK